MQGIPDRFFQMRVSGFFSGGWKMIPKFKPLKRKISSHKGDNGKLLVVGGSDDYPGALFLAGIAAYRSGVDSVTVAAPSKVAWALNCMSPDLITVKFKGSYFRSSSAAKVVRLSENFDCVLIGNGLGVRSETKRFARAVCGRIEKPKVIDADAVKSLKLQEVSSSILTPHRREFEILVRNSGVSEESFREVLGANILLLKGHVDRVVSKRKVYLNRTGHPGMTVAGTGDVLAGLAAGILAQTGDLLGSALAGARISGLIGERLSKKHGSGYVASDMLGLIGREVFE